MYQGRVQTSRLPYVPSQNGGMGITMKRLFYFVSFVLLLTTCLFAASCGCDHENAALLKAKEATCTSEGFTGILVCPDCKKAVDKGSVIPVRPHSEVVEGAREATCEAPGYSGDKVCSHCHVVLEKGTETDQLAHTVKLQNVAEPTCTATGYTGDSVCSVCSTVTEFGKRTDKIPHSFEISGGYEASCTCTGYSGDRVCKDCGTSEKGEIIPLKEHNFDNNECTECQWLAPGLYVDNKMMLSWQQLRDGGYVEIKNGRLMRTNGDFGNGLLVIGEDIDHIDGNTSLGFNNGTLSEVWIPRSVTNLGCYLLNNNKSITTVRMFCPIDTLPNEAFKNAKALREVYLSETMVSIGSSAFQGCVSLEKVHFPAGFKTISAEAFYGSGITEITVPEGVDYIGLRAFGGSKLVSIKLPSSITTFADGVFQFCYDLTSVDMSSCTSITVIGNNVFGYCKKLTDLKLPGSIVSINNNSFELCESLKSLVLPEKLNTIMVNAFKGCGLEEAVIPTSLINMGGLSKMNLTKIKYTGDEMRWKMSTGPTAFPNVPVEFNYQPE